MVFSVQIKLSFKCIKRSQKDRTKDDRVTYQKCSKATIKKQTHEDDDDETTPYQVATGAPKFERSVADISKKEQRSTYGTYISLDRNRALVWLYTATSSPVGITPQTHY